VKCLFNLGHALKYLIIIPRLRASKKKMLLQCIVWSNIFSGIFWFFSFPKLKCDLSTFFDLHAYFVLYAKTHFSWPTVWFYIGLPPCLVFLWMNSRSLLIRCYHIYLVAKIMQQIIVYLPIWVGLYLLLGSADKLYF